MAIDAGFEDPDVMHVLQTLRPTFNVSCLRCRVILGEFHESGVHLEPARPNYDEAFAMYRKFLVPLCLLAPKFHQCNARDQAKRQIWDAPAATTNLVGVAIFIGLAGHHAAPLNPQQEHCIAWA